MALTPVNFISAPSIQSSIPRMGRVFRPTPKHYVLVTNPPKGSKSPVRVLRVLTMPLTESGAKSLARGFKSCHTVPLNVIQVNTAVKRGLLVG